MVSETDNKNKGGRPSLNYNVILKIRMPEHLYDALCCKSAETRASINQLMVDALEAAYCEYETELKERFNRICLDNLP